MANVNQVGNTLNGATGTGQFVGDTSPTLVTPNIGVATATSVNKTAITAPATGSTITIADGKTLTASNTVTLTGTDGASVNVGAGGTVLYAGANWTLVETSVASSSTSVTFTGLSSAYKVYVVLFTSVVPATNATGLMMRTSSNNGVSYDNGASDYTYGLVGENLTVSTPFGGNSTGDTKIDMGQNQSNVATNGGCNGSVFIFNPSAASYCNICINSMYYNTAASGVLGILSWAQRVSAADVDAIQFLYSSGNIASGTFKLYGVN